MTAVEDLDTATVAEYTLPVRKACIVPVDLVSSLYLPGHMTCHGPGNTVQALDTLKCTVVEQTCADVPENKIHPSPSEHIYIYTTGNRAAAAGEEPYPLPTKCTYDLRAGGRGMSTGGHQLGDPLLPPRPPGACGVARSWRPNTL